MFYQNQPRDACARGFFVPESQGMILNLVVNDVIHDVLFVTQCKSSNNWGECAKKVAKLIFFRKINN